MSINSSNVKITSEIERFYDRRYARIICHNNSNIDIKSIKVSYKFIDHKGITENNHTESRFDLSAGEKTEVFKNELYISIKRGKLIIYKIEVKAADGSIFDIPNTPTFNCCRSPFIETDRIQQGNVYTAATGFQPSGKDENNLAILMDILAIFFGFFSPLIFFLTMKDKNFLHEQSRNVLNATIIYTIAFIIGTILNATVVLAIIGLPLMLAVGVLALYSLIMAAIKNSNGEIYYLPFIPNLIK